MYYKIASRRSHFDVIFLFLTFSLVLTFPFIYLFFFGKTSSTKVIIPEIRPPIVNSLPNGFRLESTLRRVLQSSTGMSFEDEIRQRFFTNEGPTSLYSLIDDVDGRIQSLNDRNNGKTCVDSAPIGVNLTNWPGEEDIEMWFQCYEEMTPSDLFIMFGVKDGKVYLYESGLATSIAAIIHVESEEDNILEYPCCLQVNGGGSLCECNRNTNECTTNGNCETVDVNWPINNFVNATVDVTRDVVDTTLPSVDLYYSVGGNWEPNESGSRGLVHIRARPVEKRFEASIAGIGLGFCGVQFSSIGDKMKILGSVDGVGGTCEAINHTCVSYDLETIYSMEACEDISFTIKPLGRQMMDDFLGQLNLTQWDASTYPGTTNVVDISDNPMSNVYFGPSEVPASMGGRNFGQST